MALKFSCLIWKKSQETEIEEFSVEKENESFPFGITTTVVYQH